MTTTSQWPSRSWAVDSCKMYYSNNHQLAKCGVRYIAPSFFGPPSQYMRSLLSDSSLGVSWVLHRNYHSQQEITLTCVSEGRIGRSHCSCQQGLGMCISLDVSWERMTPYLGDHRKVMFPLTSHMYNAWKHARKQWYDQWVAVADQHYHSPYTFEALDRLHHRVIEV